ncbi:MAG: 6-bladed beta-propeller [bacterium]|nr:6-bladed beta-propeller [bacterium]
MTNLIKLLFIFLMLLNCGQSNGEKPADEAENSSTTAGSGPKITELQNISIEFIRQIGEIENEDENYAFYMPQDLARDSEGNLLVVDEGNFRIMKYDPEGIFMTSYGKQGQGPNEFTAMNSITIDDEGNFYIADPIKNRIVAMSPEGKEFKRYEANKLYGPVKVMKSGDFVKPSYNYEGDLLDIINREGKKVKGIGKIHEYRDHEITKYSRYVSIDIDESDNIYVAYQTRNLIEKYSPEGSLLLNFDRQINYEETTEYKTKTYNIDGQAFQYPMVNNISSGIAIDSKGNIWVVTFNRQLNESELSMVTTMSVGGRSGNTQILEKKLRANSDLTTTDAYILEVFDPAGNLLMQFPMNCYCDKIKIFANSLYILDVRKGMCVYEYRIDY